MAPRTTGTSATSATGNGSEAAGAGRGAGTGSHLNATQLAARGWTPAMIRDFLGRPDRTEFIPRFRQAAPTLLFELSRVQAAERTAKFAQRREVAARRSAAAKEAAHRRRVELLRLMSADEVPIPQLAPDVLADRAIRHREPRTAIDASSADSNTLNRWKVNYLRHQLTRYDSMIEGMFGQVGRAAAEKLLLRRALEAIGKTYPDLLDECQRQLRVSERRSR